MCQGFIRTRNPCWGVGQAVVAKPIENGNNHALNPVGIGANVAPILF